MTLPTPMFEATQPAGAKDLKRVSQFERESGELPLDADAGVELSASGTRLSALNPSLLQDLQRFDSRTPGDGLEPMEVMAAALRHARPLLMQLQVGLQVMPLTVWPLQWQLQCPLSLPELLQLRLDELRVLSVEPAGHDAPEPGLTQLRPLLWELALRGARGQLLPEIGGIATYRIAPGAELHGLDIAGSLRAAVVRLQRDGTPLQQIAAFPDFDLNRATRLLNALYLQAALMISRSHPSGIPAA